MDLSLLLHPSPPLPPLRLRRRRVHSLPRCSAAGTSTSSTTASASIFGGKKELSGVQPLIDALSPPARLAGSVAIAAAALAAGYGLGFRVAGTRTAGLAGAAALGVAGGALVYKINSDVPEVAAVSLHNLVAGYDDPLALEKEQVEAIAKRYGVSKQDEAFKTELCDLYSRFVYSVLPPGGENLKGNEVETIIKFKESLGIDDPDAANVHMEIGRRIFRERLETGDREADAEQRQAFQKLIYVSNLVFGEASTFLLPWKRLFKVTDSQVELAIRENAKKLYSIKLESVGRDIEAQQLIELRKSQLLYKLSDEIAAEMFMEHTRKLIELNVSSALDIVKSRSKALKEGAHAIEELEKILAFNDLLTGLVKLPEASQFAPGVGPVSLLGGEFGDRKIDDLKLLYRAYATEAFPDGRIDEKKIVSLNKLRNIFGLGNREAEKIMLEIKSAVYRKRLSKAFTAELAAAPSKAAFLQNLCEELDFDPENASKLNEEIYRQKLQQFVADNELSKEEVEALMTFQVRLCIPQAVVDEIHTEICGKLFAKVVEGAISSGVNGFDGTARASVKKAAQGLQLSRETAMEIASKAVRKALLIYVRRARRAANRIETAKELKKMIEFNTLVITNLLSDIKGEPVTPEPVTTENKEDKEKQDKEKKDEEEDVELKSLKNLKPKREDAIKQFKPSQTEITLKDDLPYPERSDLYETYLHYCRTGDTTTMPFGLHLPTKSDKNEYRRLDQLGGILGLSTEESKNIRNKIAEKSFTKEAEVILADGQLTKARIEQLARVQSDVGLPNELAQKVIKNITRTKMAASIEAAVNRGRMGLKEVRELKEAKVVIDDVISEELRETIFKKALEEVFSNGKGVFDEEEVCGKIPEDLSIDKEKARKVVVEIAKGRIGGCLVQAVSLLRQKNQDGVIASLNDMLTCDVAAPTNGPLSWSNLSELDDLYCIYLKSIPKPERLSRLQSLLGISDEKAETLQDAARDGVLPIGNVEEEAEEEEFAF